jgi:5-methylcytosine-specific restriction endonuclease McrA|tara:strand:+ start:1025 stop:1378 length:354 start_codon:yes stop_codon:yes gene_type:complete
MPYKDKTKQLEFNKEWLRKDRIKNPERHRLYKKTYLKTVKGRRLKVAGNAKYRANVRKACPSWTSIGEIQSIYKDCPDGYHVDHIVPLTNNKVSGLHVPHNLQYLTPKDNKKKGNKF